MSDDVEEALSCHLCLEIYKEPLQLSCNHSLCRMCLERLKESSVGTVLQCPECREVVRESEVDRNDLLAAIVEFYWEMSARADRHKVIRNLETEHQIASTSGQQAVRLLDSSRLPSASNSTNNNRQNTDSSQTNLQVPNNQQPQQNQGLPVGRHGGQVPSNHEDDTDVHPSIDLELRLKQLKQVHYQECVQQHHLQCRLRNLQSLLQIKKLKVLQRNHDGAVKDWHDVEKMAVVLAQFGDSLRLYGKAMNTFHESQLRSIQLAATCFALKPEKQKPQTFRVKKNQPEVNKEQNSRQVSQHSSEPPRLVPVQELTRGQIEKQIVKVQQTFDESQQQHQRVWTQLPAMKQKQRSKWANLEPENTSACEHFQQREKDLLLFEAKMNQFEKLQSNLHSMKLQHLHDKLNKLN